MYVHCLDETIIYRYHCFQLFVGYSPILLSAIFQQPKQLFGKKKNCPIKKGNRCPNECRTIENPSSKETIQCSCCESGICGWSESKEWVCRKTCFPDCNAKQGETEANGDEKEGSNSDEENNVENNSIDYGGTYIDILDIVSDYDYNNQTSSAEYDVNNGNKGSKGSKGGQKNTDDYANQPSRGKGKGKSTSKGKGTKGSKSNNQYIDDYNYITKGKGAKSGNLIGKKGGNKHVDGHDHQPGITNGKGKGGKKKGKGDDHRVPTNQPTRMNPSFNSQAPVGKKGKGNGKKGGGKDGKKHMLNDDSQEDDYGYNNYEDYDYEDYNYVDYAYADYDYDGNDYEYYDYDNYGYNNSSYGDNNNPGNYTRKSNTRKGKFGKKG